MGYYTKYELTITGQSDQWVEGRDAHGKVHRVNLGPVDYSKIRRELTEITGYSDPFGDSIKWYDHDDHMREISRRYPDLLFTLEGVGEEAGDMWCKYYQKGLCQHELARIEYGKFDPAKLK